MMPRKPDWVLLLAVAFMVAPWVLAVTLIVQRAF